MGIHTPTKRDRTSKSNYRHDGRKELSISVHVAVVFRQGLQETDQQTRKPVKMRLIANQDGDDSIISSSRAPRQCKRGYFLRRLRCNQHPWNSNTIHQQLRKGRCGRGRGKRHCNKWDALATHCGCRGKVNGSCVLNIECNMLPHIISCTPEEKQTHKIQ